MSIQTRILDGHKITTSYVYPPIPDRDNDWCAYVDEECGPYGWGRTEDEAIQNLLEALEDNRLRREEAHV
jgi:hypothetical protein